ncbi:hypothetical protein HanIR_Chr17g0893971 [Helianthus annuus]|nr:hypothetical protein HanIR_Chr17g0893971 [Helianthus annuus]
MSYNYIYSFGSNATNNHKPNETNRGRRKAENSLLPLQLRNQLGILRFMNRNCLTGPHKKLIPTTPKLHNLSFFPQLTKETPSPPNQIYHPQTLISPNRQPQFTRWMNRHIIHPFLMNLQRLQMHKRVRIVERHVSVIVRRE